MFFPDPGDTNKNYRTTCIDHNPFQKIKFGHDQHEKKLLRIQIWHVFDPWLQPRTRNIAEKLCALRQRTGKKDRVCPVTMY